jgi:flagellar hook-length control protein FliK
VKKVKINLNLNTNVTSKKLDILKQVNKKEEFKKFLDKQELRSNDSSNKNVDEKCSKDENLHKINDDKQGNDLKNSGAENSIAKDSNKPDENDKLKAKVINLIETSIDALKPNTESTSKELEGTDKSAEEMAQIQQLLQFLNSMFQNVNETSATVHEESELNSINVEELIGGEKLSADTKNLLKSNLSEIIGLLEKSKGNKAMSSEILAALQKLTSEVRDTKSDLNLPRISDFQTIGGNTEEQSIKDNLLKKVTEQNIKVDSEVLPKSEIQSLNNASKDSKFSGNSSSEEKFLSNLLGEDKDEMKISKAVNFMNQFEAVKTLDASKVQTQHLVIDKNSFQADIIKTMKFMEINNVKDLTVKMNPKELGEITIKLTMESGIMKANISAQNKDTYNLLNSNIQDIGDKLKNMDIKIQSLDINIYEDSTFFNKDSNERNNNGRQSNNKGTNALIEDEDISIGNNYAIEENQVNKFV